MASKEGVRRFAPQLAAVALAVLSGCACFVIYYATRVCDEQLTDSGMAVNVCRHLTLTDPPIVVAGVIGLLALTAFFNEISGFGFTLKRGVRDAVRNAEVARSESQATRAVAETTEQLVLQSARNSAVASVDSTELDALATEYDNVRASQASGSARTSQMSEIVSRMINVAAPLSSQLDVRSRLRSADGGVRITAYAFIYVHLDPALTSPLVQALLAEPTAFGQYWAIRALRGLVRRHPTALTQDERRHLKHFLGQLPPDTDRIVELSGALAEAG